MISFINRTFIQLAFIVSILFVAACSNVQNPDDSKDVADEQNEAKFDNNKQEEDAQFLVKAAEINLQEIQLGQLAQQSGNSSHVRELGKMMEDAHTKSFNDLTVLARKKMATIPNAPTEHAQEACNTLKEKSGNEFDKAYADKMVSIHKDAIETFEKASTDSKDTDIKNWASASLPGLRKHLDNSIECQKKCEKM